jgi:hypothetical protein
MFTIDHHRSLTRLILLAILFLGSAHASAAVAVAADCTWTGASPNGALWNDNRNWTNCNNTFPHGSDTVTFPDGGAQADNHFNLTADSPGVLTIVGRATGNAAWDIIADTIVFLRSVTVTAPPDAHHNGPAMHGRVTLADDTTITTHADPNGRSTFELGNPATPIDLNGHTLTFNTESPVSVVGSITGNCPGPQNALIKDGPSDLFLDVNSYCGVTMIRAGTVIAETQASPGQSQNDLSPGTELTVVLPNGTLQLSRGMVVLDTVALEGTLRAPMSATASTTDVIHASTARIVTEGGTVRIGGRLSGEGGPTMLTVSGSGALELSTLAVQLRSTVAGTGYDQIDLQAGSIHLTGTEKLELSRSFDVRRIPASRSSKSRRAPAWMATSKTSAKATP